MHQLTLGNLLVKKACEVKSEALGRIRVAVAGIQNNCFHAVMKQSFSYSPAMAAGDVTTAGEESDLGGPSIRPPPDTRPRSKSARLSATAPAGSDTEHLSPKVTGAKVFKPGPEPKFWSKTGLASDFTPKKTSGDEDYQCPFPDCNYPGKQKLDTAATHIRRDHLNVCIGCHHCEGVFWSAVSWGKHCDKNHKDLPRVPAGAENPGVFSPLTDSDIVEIKQEEQQAIADSLGLGDMDIEPDVEIVDEFI